MSSDRDECLKQSNAELRINLTASLMLHVYYHNEEMEGECKKIDTEFKELRKMIREVGMEKIKMTLKPRRKNSK